MTLGIAASISIKETSGCRIHSGASSVTVQVAIEDGNARLEVVDDGQGFEVERVLRRAPRRGRLGLIGMRERTRLLDGSFSVQSQPGGPTSIVAVLPAWRPLGPTERAAGPGADEAAGGAPA